MYGHLHNQTWSAFRPSFKWRGQHFPGFLPHAGRRFTVTRRKRALACIHRHLSVKDAKKGFIALAVQVRVTLGPLPSYWEEVTSWPLMLTQILTQPLYIAPDARTLIASWISQG